MDALVERVKQAMDKNEIVSIAYLGNVVEIWERFDEAGIFIHVGSDQTSLHNPWSGGYYPVDVSFDESNRLLREEPDVFKEKVQESLRRHAASINKHTAKGTYFFDYGNAFLLESSRAGADIMAENGIDFRYPSYVQDILDPCALTMDLGHFDGYVLRESRKTWIKRMI